MDSLRILLYSFIFLLSVFGNLLIIVVLVANKRMRTVTNSFLLSLAISDLMMAVFCMPFTLIPNLLEDFIFGAAMCKIVAYLMGKMDCHFFKCTGFKHYSLNLQKCMCLQIFERYSFFFFFFTFQFSLSRCNHSCCGLKLSHSFLCRQAFLDLKKKKKDVYEYIFSQSWQQ